MSKSENGGAAFPNLNCGNHFQSHGGMTMLDYFAGQALVAAVASRPHWNSAELAAAAFATGRAMVAERAKLIASGVI